MEDEEVSEYSDIMEEAKEVKKSLNLESIDTAIQIMIYKKLDKISEDVDTLRFNNSD